MLLVVGVKIMLAHNLAGGGVSVVRSLFAPCRGINAFFACDKASQITLKIACCSRHYNHHHADTTNTSSTSDRDCCGCFGMITSLTLLCHPSIIFLFITIINVYLLPYVAQHRESSHLFHMLNMSSRRLEIIPALQCIPSTLSTTVMTVYTLLVVVIWTLFAIIIHNPSGISIIIRAIHDVVKCCESVYFA